MKLVVEFADVSIPGVRRTAEPDQELGDLGQHVAALRQDLVEASHGGVDYKPDRGGDAALLVNRSPRVVVAEGCIVDEVSRGLGE